MMLKIKKFNSEAQEYLWPVNADPVETLQACTIEDLWVELLQSQNEFYRRTVLEFFYNCQSFQSAQTVVDLGCGPADLLMDLNGRFSDKEYCGVDSSSNYVELAQTACLGHPNIEIKQADILDYSEQKFDFLVLRFVVQHLSDHGKLMSQLESMLKPQGRVAIIDVCDQLKLYSPNIPELDKMYQNMAILQKAKGGNRDAVETVESLCLKGNFTPEYSVKRPVVAHSSDEKDIFVHLFMLVSEIVRRKYQVPVDQIQLYRELKGWQFHPFSYAQLGLKFLVFS